MSCVYCDPKSRITTVWVSTLQVWQGAGRDVKNGEQRVPALLIVIPRLQKVDLLGDDAIDEPVRLHDAQAPAAGLDFPAASLAGRAVLC